MHNESSDNSHSEIMAALQTKEESHALNTITPLNKLLRSFPNGLSYLKFQKMIIMFVLQEEGSMKDCGRLFVLNVMAKDTTQKNVQVAEN